MREHHIVETDGKSEIQLNHTKMLALREGPSKIPFAKQHCYFWIEKMSTNSPISNTSLKTNDYHEKNDIGSKEIEMGSGSGRRRVTKNQEFLL